MIINYLNFYKMLIPFLLVLTIYCGTAPIAGSETTNGLTVAVVDNTFQGTTVPSSYVYCYSSTYNPDSNTGYSDTAFTDPQGTFTFENCPLSTYTIYTYSPDVDSAAIIQNISNSANKPDTNTQFKSVVSIAGTTRKSDGIIENARVYIHGTSFATTSDSSGRFSMQNLPQGTFTLYSYVKPTWIKGVLSDSTTINLSENINRGVSVTLTLK
jgi:hypothetical protein